MEQSNKFNLPNFYKRYPVLSNVILIAVAACVLMWLGLVGLDVWTDHGNYKVVPDMRGLAYDDAAKALRAAGLQPELSDSVYDNSSRPGVVLEQSPRVDTKVKPNRTVYLTINALTPKMLTIPNLADMSVRQARSMLEGIGIKHIEVREVPSEYRDLVLGVKFNGVELQPGARVPVSATITLLVGQGVSEEADSEIVEEAVAEDEEAATLDLF